MQFWEIQGINKMKTGLILLFLAQLGFSWGFFPELNFPVEEHQVQESLGGNRNLPENDLEQARNGCGQPMDEDEEGQLKLITRLKRMTACSGGTPSVGNTNM